MPVAKLCCLVCLRFLVAATSNNDFDALSLVQLQADIKQRINNGVVGVDGPNIDGKLELLQTQHVAQISGWNWIGAVTVVVGLGAAFLIAGLAFPTLSRPLVSIIVMMVYITLSVSIDLLIMSQKNSPNAKTLYEFDPTCAVILTETIKLGISLTLYASNRFIAGVQFLPEGLSLYDACLFALPAAFFTANNIMVFVAIGENDSSVFGVFRDTMILWTAFIWRCIFRSHLGPIRLFGIAVIFAGLVLNRLGSYYNGGFGWGFLLVMLMTITNACGSVVNEWALKRNRALDINIQNSVLYSMCIFFSFVVLRARNPGHLYSAAAFFEGVTSRTALMVCMQASAGLLVSRLLKYADSVYKTIGTCLRGPVLVFVAPVILGSRQDLSSLASAVVVASGCLTYLTQGPMTEPAAKGDDKMATERSSEAEKNGSAVGGQQASQ